MAKPIPHFELFKGKGKQPWRWRFRATNGKIQAQSEGHPTKDKAHRAARGLARNILIAYYQHQAIEPSWVNDMIRDGKPRK